MNRYRNMNPYEIFHWTLSSNSNVIVDTLFKQIDKGRLISLIGVSRSFYDKLFPIFSRLNYEHYYISYNNEKSGILLAWPISYSVDGVRCVKIKRNNPLVMIKLSHGGGTFGFANYQQPAYSNLLYTPIVANCLHDFFKDLPIVWCLDTSNLRMDPGVLFHDFEVGGVATYTIRYMLDKVYQEVVDYICGKNIVFDNYRVGRVANEDGLMIYVDKVNHQEGEFLLPDRYHPSTHCCLVAEFHI